MPNMIHKPWMVSIKNVLIAIVCPWTFNDTPCKNNGQIRWQFATVFKLDTLPIIQNQIGKRLSSVFWLVIIKATRLSGWHVSDFLKVKNCKSTSCFMICLINPPCVCIWIKVKITNYQEKRELKEEGFFFFIRGVSHNYLDWAKYQNRHSSKSIWVTKLVFCQNDSPIRGSFWQKDSLITHKLFENANFDI